ncbi:MAG: patatin-like phospholipase family protein [Pseudomonadota bacterium]
MAKDVLGASTRGAKAGVRAGVLTVLAAWALVGCASITRTPAPPDDYFKARVPDFPFARFYGDKPLPEHAFDLVAWRENRAPLLESRRVDAAPAQAHLLLLSGGGPDGAFGAGVLNGWSAYGDRPEFEIVTGVSIGALMAPFAFLGPDHDARLREMFLRLRGRDDIVQVEFFGVIGGAIALGDTAPLRRLIEEYVDEALLDAIAVEHRKGRRLFVGTTNLDARRPITWNMGEIAISDRPERLQLFRDVLLASASVPGLTPPVFIDVELDGRVYQEMHVDGGVMNSVILAVPTLTEEMRLAKFGETIPNLWVIQNNKLRAPYEPTQESLGGVLATTISELIRSQSRGDQSRLYFLSERERINYRLAAVPKAFTAPGGDEFDPDYLKRLFDEGERLARNGYPWRRAPSSLERLQLFDDDEADEGVVSVSRTVASGP